MEAHDFNYFYEFECEYEAIKRTTTDVLELSFKMIEFIQEKLKEIGKWLKKHLFTSVQEEIQFFKDLKPKIVSKLIFHQSILKIENKLPPTKKKKKKHYEKELVNIYEYGMNNKEFYEYYRSKGFPTGLSGANPSPKVYFCKKLEKNIINNTSGEHFCLPFFYLSIPLTKSSKSSFINSQYFPLRQSGPNHRQHH